MNPVDWSKTQDLLLKLVQVLTPLAVKEMEAGSFFLNKRFFIPPSEEAEIQRPVKLLSQLQSIQKGFEQWVEKKGEGGDEKKPLGPIAKEAKSLIRQVHEAIGKLSSSANFKNPQEIPLREALKKLKPQLDRMIESVTCEEKEIFVKREILLRHPLPKPSRDFVIHKSICVPYVSSQNPILRKRKKRRALWLKDEKKEQRNLSE